MAYNYSPDWLTARKELVTKLLKLAQTGEVLMVTSKSWDELQPMRREVSNVLASIAVNMPEYKDARTMLRCWTDYNKITGEWSLCVGKPVAKISGRPPGGHSWSKAYIPGTIGSDYLFEGHIEDQDSLSKFVGTVIALDPSVRTARASVADFNDEAVAFFTDLFIAHGWTASKAEDGKLLLTRST